MANVAAFKAFLKERQTGLRQRSKAWVKARQHTIGASEIAALTGASPFDTPWSLIQKKLHPPDLSKNIVCAWGKLFKPFARAYLEWEHNTHLFGNTISLNLAKDHPLYGKVTCSPDGYFQALDLSSSALSHARSQCTKPRLTTATRYRPVLLSAERVSPKACSWMLVSGCAP